MPAIVVITETLTGDVTGYVGPFNDEGDALDFVDEVIVKGYSYKVCSLLQTTDLIRWKLHPERVLISTRQIKMPVNYPRRLAGCTKQVDDLELSIRERGVCHPLHVREVGPGVYQAEAGVLRLIACKRIGLSSVPCLVYKKVITHENAKVLQSNFFGQVAEGYGRILSAIFGRRTTATVPPNSPDECG